MQTMLERFGCLRLFLLTQHVNQDIWSRQLQLFPVHRQQALWYLRLLVGSVAFARSFWCLDVIQLLLRFPWMHRVFEPLPQSFIGELRHQQRPDHLAFAQMRTGLPKCFLLISDWFLVRFLCESKVFLSKVFVWLLRENIDHNYEENFILSMCIQG